MIEHSNSAQSAENQQPDYGGRIRFGSIGEPSNLIPALSTDSASQEIAGLLYTAPLEYDKDFNIVLLAAESWEVLEDGCFMRFKLREDIKWQDGAPLTADDVRFTYELMINPTTPTAYAADYLLIKEFKQTGTYTFEVRYDAPYARSAITWMHAIMPKHVLEGEDIVTTRFARDPIGAGPYRLKSWESGRVTLDANPLYFKGKPYIDEVVYRIIPDLSTMFLEAKAGKLDFLGLSPQQYLRQTNGGMWDKDWRKYKYLSPGYTFLGFNLTNPLFSDLQVRQALSYAIDREGIIKGVLLGLGEPTIGPYKPGTWVYNDALSPYAYNPEKAKAMLAEAGWKDNNNDGVLDKGGLEFRFTILVNQGNDQRIKTATILQHMFRDVGVECKIRTVEWAAFIKEFVNKGNFEALILAWNILDDPDIFDVWHSSTIKENGLNFVHYRNAEVDAMLEQGRATADKAERKILYDRMQAILHEEQPYLFLYVPYALPMVGARYQGIEPAPAGIMYNFDKWWIPKALQN